MEEDKDIVGNIKYVQDAFIFYPIMRPIQMDKILEQGIFLREKEMSQIVKTRLSL